MTKTRLGEILGEMYFNAPKGEAVAMIHLFGIQYADEIKSTGITSRELTEIARIQPSYATEISKAVKLSKYVQVR